MRLSYLGKFGRAGVSVILFFDLASHVVVSVLRADGHSIVQGFKKLEIRRTTEKLDVARLHALVSNHRATIEVATAPPMRELAEAESPKASTKIGWLERTFERVEGELTSEKAEYEKWRGVRDMDEAMDNHRKRRDEIFEFEKEMIRASREPSFVLGSHYVSQPFQSTDAFRTRELRDQAKDRASALRLRIDFTFRTKIKELEQKRRDLLGEIEEERKHDESREKSIARTLDDSTAVAAMIVLRSAPFHVEGRRGAAVRAVVEEVAKSAVSLRRDAKEKIGVELDDPKHELAFSPIWIPTARATGLEGAFHLAPSDAVEKAIASLFTDHAEKPQDLSRFPRFSPKRRLAYLGLAADSSHKPSGPPVFYDFDEQAPRHTAVVGGSGSGKSVAASLIVESAASNGIQILIVDPTRRWTGLASPCASGPMLSRYAAFHLRPDWVRGFPVEIVEDASSDVRPNGTTVIASNQLSEAAEIELVERVLSRIYSEMQTWPETKRLRLLIVLEEAHRYLKAKSLQPLLEPFARTARAKGVGLLIVSQVAVDLPPAIRANCATKIQMQTNYSGDLSRVAQVFGSEFRKVVPTLPQGVGAIHYPEYGSAIVAFRPPLHGPTALSEEAAKLYSAQSQLRAIIGQLLGQADTTRTDDVRCDDREENAAGDRAEPSERKGTSAADSPRTFVRWRDAAASAFSPGMSALALHQELTKRGVTPPSVRTLRRFIRARP